MTAVFLPARYSILAMQSLVPIRHLSTCCKRNAGFQSAQSGLSMEVRQRLIDRKKKKVEKLKKQPLEMIPIVDFFLPYSWKTDAKKRKNPELSEDVKEERILLEKQWGGYITKQHVHTQNKLRQLQFSQEKALNELKKESLSLYNAALKCVDYAEFPFSCQGPVQTLPLVAYVPPLGGFDHKEAPFSSDDTTVLDIED